MLLAMVLDPDRLFERFPNLARTFSLEDVVVQQTLDAAKHLAPKDAFPFVTFVGGEIERSADE